MRLEDNPMPADLPEFVHKSFPDAWYNPKFKLLGWFPRGILDEAFVDRMVEFIEMEERIQEAPFDRYVDFSGLSQIQLRMGHIIQVARRRHPVKQPVKTAIFANQSISFGIALMYERLMHGSMIEVRAFQKRELVAVWLDVPMEVLSKPLGDSSTMEPNEQVC
jgi:hypothetical protein